MNNLRMNDKLNNKLFDLEITGDKNKLYPLSPIQ